MRQKPILVMFEKRNALHHQIEKEEGEREDRRGGGLHVEAREHKGQPQYGRSINSGEYVRKKVESESFPRGQDTERCPRQRNEHAPPREPHSSKAQCRSAKHTDEENGENCSGKPFRQQKLEAGNRPREDHAQG